MAFISSRGLNLCASILVEYISSSPYSQSYSVLIIKDVLLRIGVSVYRRYSPVNPSGLGRDSVTYF